MRATIARQDVTEFDPFEDLDARHAVAEWLDRTIGDALDDVRFAEVVDGVVNTLGPSLALAEARALLAVIVTA